MKKIFIFLATLAIVACGKEGIDDEPAPKIVGRWMPIEGAGMYVFRNDGNGFLLKADYKFDNNYESYTKKYFADNFTYTAKEGASSLGRNYLTINYLNGDIKYEEYSFSGDTLIFWQKKYPQYWDAKFINYDKWKKTTEAQEYKDEIKEIDDLLSK